MQKFAGPMDIKASDEGHQFWTTTPANPGELQRHSSDSGVNDPYSSEPQRHSADG